MRLYNVKQACLFGSAASGTMNPKSDVDFLVRFSPGLDFETYGSAILQQALVDSTEMKNNR